MVRRAVSKKRGSGEMRSVGRNEGQGEKFVFYSNEMENHWRVLSLGVTRSVF